jgi:hypothetical protein
MVLGCINPILKFIKKDFSIEKKLSNKPQKIVILVTLPFLKY